MQKNILDCTLRDGGYVNDWAFDTETTLAIMDGLYDSGVRYIEIGILGSGATRGKQTKFNNFSEMELLMESRKHDCHYAVMLTQESSGDFVFPQCSEKTPDCIRLAYFAPAWKETINKSTELKNKGYNVFLQAMATFMYSKDELDYMLEAINELDPAAFYMVDSFSSMYPYDVKIMRNEILKKLSPNIAFGFHAHNNIQMAYANSMEFLDCSEDRVFFIDASIFGMGRGAGNVPTELLMNYLNRFIDEPYKIDRVLELYQSHLKVIYEKYGWGYSLPYYLTATQKVNSAYAWYFGTHGVDDLADLKWALEQLPKSVNYTLKPSIANDIIERLQDRER